MEAFLEQYWWGVLIAAIWELAWKGRALWRAAKYDDKPWFIILLLVNTLGVLPIAYLFIFSKQHSSERA